MKKNTSTKSILVLAAGLMALAAPLSGCKNIVEAIGYRVVDEQLEDICSVRDDATQEYVDATLPLLKDAFEGEDLLRMKDLGETLKRVSRKERDLVTGEAGP